MSDTFDSPVKLRADENRTLRSIRSPEKELCTNDCRRLQNDSGDLLIYLLAFDRRDKNIYRKRTAGYRLTFERGSIG